MPDEHDKLLNDLALAVYNVFADDNPSNRFIPDKESDKPVISSDVIGYNEIMIPAPTLPLHQY